jgi:glutamine cyclotransferase
VWFLSAHVADAYIQLEIARMALSVSPAADQTFVMGMIAMAEMLGQLTYQEAEAYREALERKTGNRIVELRRAA